MSRPFPDAALSQHIIVLGKTGAGKSSVMRYIVEDLLERGKPVCILDPKGDWWGLKSSADGKSAGHPVVIFGGEHADVPINAHAGAHVAELVATGNRPCIIDLGGWMVGDRTRFFIDFASTLFRHTRGPRWLVIDEVHNFCPQGKVLDPDAGKMLHWANRLASEGRGKGLTLISASQRPQKVHKDFVTSCETLIAMRVIHPLDRGAIKDWIDGCPDPAKGREVLGSLAEMPRGTGWVWSPEIGFGPVLVKFPMFATYDSFKPQSAEAAGKLKGWAEVDLDEVKARLETVVKEAQANDPRLLRQRIAELEREVRKAPPAAPAPPVDTEAIRLAAFDAGYRSCCELVARGLGKIVDCNDATVAALEDLTTAISKKPQAPRITIHPQNAKRSPATDRALGKMVEHATRAAMPPRPPRSSDANGSLPPARQKILDKLLWLEDHGIYPAPKETLAAICSVSPTSGGYFNNLGALRAAGLIDYPHAGVVDFTDAGRSMARPTDDPRPVHEHWLDILPGPQRAIVEALIAIYPRTISKDELAGEIRVSPTSGGYFNNLGRLRTLGAIDYPQKGFVGLTRHVMPDN